MDPPSRPGHYLADTKCVNVRIKLTGTDLARVRFGISPLYETVTGLLVLAEPGAHAVHLPWVRWAAPRVPDDPDVRLLWRLLSGPAIPVALVPPPDSRLPEFSGELTRVRRADPDRLRRSLGSIFGTPRWLAPVYADPSGALARVAAALRVCHDRVIAPYWPRMRALLDADITYRVRQLGDAGIAGLLGRLHPDVQWSSSEGEVTVRSGPGAGGQVTFGVDGHGLVLCPSIFTWPHVLTAARPTGGPAGLRYPARGAGTLWERPAPPPHDGITALLGRTRALLLASLDEPRSTPELAATLKVTPGAVSQHLNVLRAAGLVASERNRRTVLHLRTPRADALLAP